MTVICEIYKTSDRCIGLTLPPQCADCLEIWEPQLSGTLWACPGFNLCFLQNFTLTQGLKISTVRLICKIMCLTFRRIVSQIQWQSSFHYARSLSLDLITPSPLQMEVAGFPETLKYLNQTACCCRSNTVAFIKLFPARVQVAGFISE
jgi:hypothetical protein